MIPISLRHPSPSLVIAVAAVFWGLWWLPLRLVEGDGLAPFGLNAWLYGIVAMVCVPVIWSRRLRMIEAGLPLPIAAIVFGAAILAWNLALLQGEIVRVTLLFYLSPVWGTALGWLVLGEPVGRRRMAALPLGLAGAVILLGGGGVPMPSGAGDWFGLSSGLLFALSAVIARRYRVEGISYTALSFPACAIMAAGLALWFEGGVPLPGPDVGAEIQVETILWIALVGLLWMLPVTFGLLWGSTQMDPGRLSLLMLLEVVAAAVSASLLTDEVFGLQEAAGCALILGAGLLEIGPPPKRPVPKRQDTGPDSVD